MSQIHFDLGDHSRERPWITVGDSINLAEMSSRRFTASIVITIAALPACESASSEKGPEQPPGGSSRIDHRPDGTCWETPRANCPANATCNPPPPWQVDCATGAVLPDPPPRYDPNKEGYPYATPPPATKPAD